MSFHFTTIHPLSHLTLRLHGLDLLHPLVCTRGRVEQRRRPSGAGAGSAVDDTARHALAAAGADARGAHLNRYTAAI